MTDTVRAEILRRCAEAGVTDDEMFDDPKHGLCVVLSGVQKLAARASGAEKFADLLAQMEGAQMLARARSAGSA